MAAKLWPLPCKTVSKTDFGELLKLSWMCTVCELLLPVVSRAIVCPSLSWDLQLFGEQPYLWNTGNFTLNFLKGCFPLSFRNKACWKRANCFVVTRNKNCLKRNENGIAGVSSRAISIWGSQPRCCCCFCTSCWASSFSTVLRTSSSVSSSKVALVESLFWVPEKVNWKKIKSLPVWGLPRGLVVSFPRSLCFGAFLGLFAWV